MTRTLRAAILLFWVLVCHQLGAQVASIAPIPTRLPVGTGTYDPGLDAKVEALLRKMNLEEKLRQLVQYSAGHPSRCGTGRTGYEALTTKGKARAPTKS